MNNSIYYFLETIPNVSDLKLKDAQSIVDYFLTVKPNKGVSRHELCAHSGANPFRVEPIIFELIQRGWVEEISNDATNNTLFCWKGIN